MFSDNDDKIPKEIKEFIEFLGMNMQENLNNMEDIKKVGFSISFGPDGPKFGIVDERKKIVPVFDVFYYPDKIQLILETPGISNIEQINVKIADNILQFTSDSEIPYYCEVELKEKNTGRTIVVVKNRTTIIDIAK